MTIIKILHFPWIVQIICLTADMATNSAPPKYQVQCMPPLPINLEKRESPYFCEVVGANHWGKKTERGGDGATRARGSDGNGARGEREWECESERETSRERETESEREWEWELCFESFFVCWTVFVFWTWFFNVLELFFWVLRWWTRAQKETEYNGLGFL